MIKAFDIKTERAISLQDMDGVEIEEAIFNKYFASNKSMIFKISLCSKDRADNSVLRKICFTGIIKYVEVLCDAENQVKYQDFLESGMILNKFQVDSDFSNIFGVCHAKREHFLFFNFYLNLNN